MDEKCSICLNEKRAPTTTFVCSHTFCQPCIVNWYRDCIRRNIRPHCALCRKVDDVWGT